MATQHIGQKDSPGCHHLRNLFACHVLHISTCKNWGISTECRDQRRCCCAGIVKCTSCPPTYFEGKCKSGEIERSEDTLGASDSERTQSGFHIESLCDAHRPGNCDIGCTISFNTGMVDQSHGSERKCQQPKGSLRVDARQGGSRLVASTGNENADCNCA